MVFVFVSIIQASEYSPKPRSCYATMMGKQQQQQQNNQK